MYMYVYVCILIKAKCVLVTQCGALKFNKKRILARSMIEKSGWPMESCGT